LPHSEISGSPGARPSPELFAACHVLHRLSVPRHPPDALLVLAHAQPQGRAKRGQRTEIREQTRRSVRPRLLSPGALRKFAPTRATRALAYLHTHARARPIHRTRPKGPGGSSCHARFTVTTRFTMSKPPRPTPPLSGRRAPISCPGGCQRTAPSLAAQPTPGGGPGPI
jgi:hypothetical protein